MSVIKRIWQKTKGVIIALAFAFVVLIILDELEKAENEKKRFLLTTEKVLPLVSVQQLQPLSTSLKVSVLSKVRPKYKSVITSQVDGQIQKFKDIFLEGNIVQKDQVLITLDDVEHVAAVAAAKHVHAEVKLALLKEERLADQAMRDWKRSNNGSNKSTVSPSPLVVRKPQLEAAKLQVDAAAADLARAERLLSFSTIKAPYTGVIVSRQVNPGDIVGINQPVAEIMSIQEFELVAQLTESQWSLLAENWQVHPPTIEDLTTGKYWKGHIRSSGYFYDEATQLRNIYVTVNTEQLDAKALLPGKLMRVSFTGKTLNNVLRVPLSAYTQDAHIWLLGNDDRLQKISPKVVAQDTSHVFLNPPDMGARNVRIALFPQNNFTLGQKVEVDLVVDNLNNDPLSSLSNIGTQ